MPMTQLALFAGEPGDGGDTPDVVWVVQRRADFGARVEVLALHRTRAGAELAAEAHNEGFTGPRQFGAQVRHIPGAWLSSLPRVPPGLEITD